MQPQALADTDSRDPAGRDIARLWLAILLIAIVGCDLVFVFGSQAWEAWVVIGSMAGVVLQPLMLCAWLWRGRASAGLRLLIAVPACCLVWLLKVRVVVEGFGVSTNAIFNTAMLLLAEAALIGWAHLASRARAEPTRWVDDGRTVQFSVRHLLLATAGVAVVAAAARVLLPARAWSIGSNDIRIDFGAIMVVVLITQLSFPFVWAGLSKYDLSEFGDRIAAYFALSSSVGMIALLLVAEPGASCGFAMLYIFQCLVAYGGMRLLRATELCRPFP